jgi:hypothetical protein
MTDRGRVSFMGVALCAMLIILVVGLFKIWMTPWGCPSSITVHSAAEVVAAARAVQKSSGQ